MRAFAVVEPGNPAVHEVEIELDAVLPHEVRLRVIRSGVCHSDVHLRTGYHDLGSAGRVSLADRGIAFPLVLGHEIVGVVEEVGGDVDGVVVGDVRLVYPWIGCGDCRHCRNGRDNLCAAPRTIGANRPGGYAELVTVPDARFLVAVDGLDLGAAATLACSGLTAYGAARKLDSLPRDLPVVVIGVGGVGLSVVAALRALGHHQVCAVDTSSVHLALARDLGATSTVVAGEGDDLAAIRAAVGGPVEAVVDLVNNGVTTALGFDVLAKGGTLVPVGLFGGDVRLPAVMLPLKAVTISGSYVGTLAELVELVELARQGVFPSVPQIPGVLDADGVAAALDRLLVGGVAGRIVLKPA